MVDVSVVIPFVNEFPQSAFTVQSIKNELSGYYDFEIILVNNYCEEVSAQGFPQDEGFAYFDRQIQNNTAPYLKLAWCGHKLSHWNAKNLGISMAQGRFLFFCDAHVVLYPGSLRCLLSDYFMKPELRNGSYHLPLSYLNDADTRRLLYMAVVNPDIGLCHYRFCSYDGNAKESTEPIPVSAMSTCGMLVEKDFMEHLGGWPQDLGIYGGGENWLNFTQAVLGRQIHVRPGMPLYHYAAPRGYRWNHFDWIRNRMLAVYLTGGLSWLQRCADGIVATGNKGSRRQIYQVMKSVLESEDLQKRREFMEREQQISLEDWIEKKLKAGFLITTEETWR